MKDPFVTLPMPLEHQLPILLHPARFKILVCGRRFGKTTIGRCAAAEGHGPPGTWRGALEGGRVWWIQPSHDDMVEVWDELKESFANLIERRIVRKNEGNRRLRFPGGGYIRLRSAEQSLRGVGLDLVILDEAALFKAEKWYKALRAALSDRRGSALFLSTPRGHNWFRHLYLKAQGLQEWATWKIPSAANWRFMPEDEIEAARREMPELAFRQEYLAEFVEGLGQVFVNIVEIRSEEDGSLIQPGVCKRPFRQFGEGLWIGRAPVENRQYISGIDIGRLHDATVVSVFDAHERRQVALLRMTGTPWPQQKYRIAQLLHAFPGHAYADATSLGMIGVDELQLVAPRRITPVTFTRPFKDELVNSLRIAFENLSIDMLRVPEQVLEFEAFEGVATHGGGIRYSAPEGLHDDIVMAAGLAVMNLGSGVLHAPSEIGEDREPARMQLRKAWKEALGGAYSSRRGLEDW